MPELLRLQTPDFEFSIWANDIDARSRVYKDTLQKRAGLIGPDLKSIPESELRFEPELKLVASTIVESEESNLEQTDGALIAGLAQLEKRAAIALKQPLFFENTQYQFEWIFYECVSCASIVHRSEILCNSFRFTAQRGPIPAILTGNFNTGNDIGWMRLLLKFEVQGRTHLQHIALEVLPTKMVLHQDLQAMYKAIDEVYPLWRFSLVEKTEQDASRSKQRGHFPLIWLANFGQLRKQFEQGLNIICAAPHSRLQTKVASIKAVKLKGRLSHKLGEQVKQDFANGQYNKRYRIDKKQLSVDTAENRFIKMAVNQCKRQLAEFESKLRSSNQAPDRQRLSDKFLDELHYWQQPLQKVLNQRFFKDVGAYNGLSSESLVLQQKTGYSSVYKVWQELKFYLDVFGNQSSISMKSVAEIYEVWCFLCIKQILEHELGFELVTNDKAKLLQNDFFEYQLKDGFAGAFKFKRSDGLEARLAHEPKFTKKGKSIRSYLVTQEPDIVLEITLPKTDYSKEDKKFIWLFDAKYRIKTDKNRFDNNRQENIKLRDYVPDDALNQMHRYRDSLISLSTSNSKVKRINGNIACESHSKSRSVFGAFALYPGFFDQVSDKNPYADAIEEINIGAFALLPSQAGNSNVGHRWLLEFLKAQIGIAPNAQNGQSDKGIYPIESMTESLYLQESARIPYSGMSQALYPDLTMTIALGGQKGRDKSYLEAFEDGTAQWYHLPQTTFSAKFRQHIAEEIRYLALASTSDTQSATKKIDKFWPIKRVLLLPRYAITEKQSGKKSSLDEPYYLFELSRPFKMQRAITHVPHRPIVNSMKLTTLSRMENITQFSDVEKVYTEAMG